MCESRRVKLSENKYGERGLRPSFMLCALAPEHCLNTPEELKEQLDKLCQIFGLAGFTHTRRLIGPAFVVFGEESGKENMAFLDSDAFDEKAREHELGQENSI